jgi:death on curing protein
VKKGPTWISKPVVLALHERLLAEHGGVPGLLDEGLLDAALAAPRHRLAHGRADLFRLAAAYARALTQDHPFCDGNKRVAFTVAGVFLELNGSRLDAPEAEAVAAVLALTTRRMSEAQFAVWLRASSSASPRRPRSRRS